MFRFTSIVNCLAGVLALFSLSAQAVEHGISLGISDFVVSDIVPSTLYDGSTSHTLGLYAGIDFTHRIAEDIEVGGSADFYLEHDSDHLDPDHIPFWYNFRVYGSGPIHRMSEATEIKWLVDLRNKQNTASGIEREIKDRVGIGLDSSKERSHFAVTGYAGFFYLEIDDDAPFEYAGYERRDLDDGTPSVSFTVEGSIRIADKYSLAGSAANWTSAGGGNEWLENQLMAEVSYDSDAWIKASSIHLGVLYTHYNLDSYYREDLGKAVLPWDSDTQIRLYVSIPMGRGR